jgi:hypothetical protein
MLSNKVWLLRVALMAASVCAMLTTSISAPSAHGIPANLAWDWSGIIGTGQSLSVGAQGLPVISTTQPYGNLKLATDHLAWPIDPNSGTLKLVPLVEPVGRLAPSYPSSWPENIDGETPHTAMANQITSMVRANLGRDFIGIHGAVGEDGQGMVFLRKNAVKKGLNGRSYEAALVETQAVVRLAKGMGKTYGVGAIIVTHGEADAGNPLYENQLRQLWQDFNTDLPAITGQEQKIQMIVSQQNSCNDRSPSTLAQWRVSDDYPADMVCSGPKYQYPSPEGVHLTAEGYRLLGEKYGEVYFNRVILGEDWRPLEPTGAERSGKILTVRFHVPVMPLVWEANLAMPHPTIAEWRNGRGFEVSTARGVRVAIDSAAISGDKVVITCASDPGIHARVGYAMVGEKHRMAAPFAGTFRWGLLRDSDPFVGAGSQRSQPNYCVAFELQAP